MHPNLVKKKYSNYTEMKKTYEFYKNIAPNQMKSNSALTQIKYTNQRNEKYF